MSDVMQENITNDGDWIYDYRIFRFDYRSKFSIDLS